MSASAGRPSTLTKLRQVYWEAKESFNKSLGQLEDEFVVASDNELDSKIELLQVADRSFNTLMRVILNYRKTLKELVDTEERFGSSLIQNGKKDPTAAGKIMCMTGKVISESARRQIRFKNNLTNLFEKVQIFQFKATTDALKTVSKMEKTRKSYRSGLMWLKNESMDIDPDVGKTLKNFRKVQEHIKRLKVKFDGMKLESMHKIDLLLLSRSNLFSNALPSYSNTFKKICRHTSISMDYALMNIPLCLSYNFVTLKELNEYSNDMQYALQNEQRTFRNREDTNPTEKSSCSLISDESTNLPAVSEQTFSSNVIKNDAVNFGDIKNNNTYSFRGNGSSGDAPLINLDEEKDSTCLVKKLTEAENLSSPKYSDDLHSINFDENQTAHEMSFTDQIRKLFEHPAMNSYPQDNSTKETDDLKFWSLIQSYDQTSSLNDLNNAVMDDSDSIRSKHSSFASDSRWKELLTEFDPFPEELIGHKIKTENLEQC